MVEAADAWYDLPWQDWLGVVGLPLAFIGLWLTWKQAKDATTAAKAARNAVRRTQAHVRANQILVLVPQLRSISSELDAAIDEENRRLARRHLDNWRWQANNVHGLLSAADAVQRKLLKSLQVSTTDAAAAGTALMGKAEISVLDECAAARESIGTACDQLSAWVGENSSKVPEGENNE